MTYKNALEIIHRQMKEDDPMSKGFSKRQNYRKWLLENPSRIEGIAESVDRMQNNVATYCQELDWFSKLTSPEDPEFKIWKAWARIDFLTEMGIETLDNGIEVR